MSDANVDFREYTPMYFPESADGVRDAYLDLTKDQFVDYVSERAEEGHPDFRALYAWLYLNNWIACADPAKQAFDWARQSRDSQDGFATWVCAWALLERGDTEEGFKEMIAAADKGFSPAIYNLGLFVWHGVAVQPDRALARELYELGADLGHHSCIAMLDGLSRHGEFGIGRKIRYYLERPFVVPFRSLKWWLSRNFTESDLLYLRNTHVQNQILGGKLDDLLRSDLVEKLNKFIGK